MSNIVLNEAALQFLLESPAGPVGQDLRRRSINVTQLVRENATKVLEELDPGLIDFTIAVTDEGLVSHIGMTSGGRMDSYLAEKEQREAVIFAPALAQGLHL